MIGDAPRAYLDNAATTPVRSEVLAAMMPHFSEAGFNPSLAARRGQARASRARRRAGCGGRRSRMPAQGDRLYGRRFRSRCLGADRRRTCESQPRKACSLHRHRASRRASRARRARRRGLRGDAARRGRGRPRRSRALRERVAGRHDSRQRRAGEQRDRDDRTGCRSWRASRANAACSSTPTRCRRRRGCRLTWRNSA